MGAETALREAVPVEVAQGGGPAAGAAWHEAYLPGSLLLRFPFALDCLRVMALARECDRREGLLIRQGHGRFQMSAAGHEALSAIAWALEPEDHIFPHYRDRPLLLARGMDVYEFALDFLARSGSSSEGRNLPGHFCSRKRNIFSIASPVASQCLPAVGAAWGFRQAGTDQVALCTIGDASTRQGEFYEAVCFATERRLPVVFVLEDNRYGISTPTRDKLPFRLGIFHEECSTRIDGTDAFGVYNAAREAVDNARAGGGPSILWCDVERLGSHSVSDDQRIYRSERELADISERDPVARLAEDLMAAHLISPHTWEVIQEQAREFVDREYRRAAAEPPPTRACLTYHLHAPAADRMPIPGIPQRRCETMADAVNRVFADGLERIPALRLFGEDIEAPKGGVFGLTKGLSERFPERVVNAPLAEATIVGTGVGLAATGFRPVFEIQFADFIAPAFNQLVSQVATLRWRSYGEWTCPLVLYAPYGAYFQGGGIWHTQSNDAWWAHIPGLRVAVPSTPEDAAGLFWSAFFDEDPSLILLPKSLFRKRVEPVEWSDVPFGRAKVRRNGTDVTVVAWGNCVSVAEAAAVEAERDGISVEVIDLRTLNPCDWETIVGSIQKTGRLVVAQEDTRTCSFGDAVVSRVTADTNFVYYFYAPPRIVSRGEHYVPYCPELAEEAVPGVRDVLDAVRGVMA